MAVDAKTVKELRRVSGAGMMECKKALDETGGDLDAALKHLREQGVKVAAKKASRQANEGLVYSYIHGVGNSAFLWRSTARPTSWPARKPSRSSASRWQCT